MSDNLTLLQKADLAIADLESNGGMLLPDQANVFVRRLIKSPTLLRVCRVVEMTGPKRYINRIGFGTRILRKAVSATALTANQRAKPTTDQIQLETEEQIAEVRLPYDVLEDNIERASVANNEPANSGPGGLRQTLIEMIAERAALDLEELGLLADEDYTSGDADDQAFMAQTDGWLSRAETVGNVADVDNASISRSVFKQGLKTMPQQYLRNRAATVHFVSNNNEIDYRDTLADRGTALGDQAGTGFAPIYAYGSPVQVASLMPEDKGLYTDPLNLIFAIQRQISMEFDKDITARVYIIVLTVKVGYQIETPEGVVVYENIGQA